ncbi:hypothetical protein RCIA196 [Methanocella arvoryzae MRE50]|uniref:Uncharacterized protein n=1 Tax=Methanocella arvoryzae (strain DSM 22066 / NBRC 105507 / MRE50) TaxID=351160 RepID=Q0W1P2_METAR|nr:hypothetical protein RCIA196 [Methanocella arvoryzae MRE50]
MELLQQAIISTASAILKKKNMKAWGFSPRTFLCLEPGLPVFGQAVPAVYWSSLCGFEGYFAFFAAVRAGCFVHLSRAVEVPGAAPGPESTVAHYWHSLEPGLPVFGQAVPAVYWSSLCGFEGYFAFFAAVRAGCFVHLSRAVEVPGASKIPGASKSTVTHC